MSQGSRWRPVTLRIAFNDPSEVGCRDTTTLQVAPCVECNARCKVSLLFTNCAVADRHAERARGSGSGVLHGEGLGVPVLPNRDEPRLAVPVTVEAGPLTR